MKVKWKPLAASIVNVNFDSAMFAESNDVGIGVVICNYKGEVMAALSKKIAHLSSVDILEMLAVRRVAQFIVELGFPQAVFKGDSVGIIKALADGYFALSSFSHLVKDFSSILGLCHSHSFSNVRRQGNSVTHALAQRVRLSFPLMIWMENVPSDVFQFVLKDFPV